MEKNAELSGAAKKKQDGQKLSVYRNFCKIATAENPRIQLACDSHVADKTGPLSIAKSTRPARHRSRLHEDIGKIFSGNGMESKQIILSRKDLSPTAQAENIIEDVNFSCEII